MTKKSWLKLNLSGVDINIQPGIKIEKSILNPIVEKISKLSQRWHLVFNSCEVYSREFTTQHVSIYLKFRLSDCEGDNEFGTLGNIPIDIKEEIISDFHKSFRGWNRDVDEFPDRGYLIFDICIKHMLRY